MDCLALCECDGFTGDGDLLLNQAFQMHLDTAFALVPDGFVCEGGEVEIAIQFPVDPLQKVLVEGCCDPGRIVIGFLQDFCILWPVHTDNQAGLRHG